MLQIVRKIDMEFLTRSVTDCSKMGVPKMVRDAEEEGLLIVTRDKNPVSILIPLSLSGLKKMVQKVTLSMNETDKGLLSVNNENFEVAKTIQSIVKLYDELNTQINQLSLNFPD